MAVHALVPAAGRGLRYGASQPKQFLEIRGRPLLVWTVERLLEWPFDALTVGVPEGWVEAAGVSLGEAGRLRWIVGGDSRQETVDRCLEASGATPEDWVAVHDGARPAVALSDLSAVISAAREAGTGAVLGRPLAETLKVTQDGTVVSTLERRDRFCAETPQVFLCRLLRSALTEADAAGFAGTDESSLVERLAAGPIRAVEAEWPNPKLTRPGDLPLVEGLLGAPRP